MNYSERLNNLADILEKTAAYIDSIESQEQAAKEAEHHEKVVAPVLSKVASVIGEELDSKVAEKLSKADPEMIDLMKKIAERREDERAQSLGGPSEIGSTKLASEDRDALLDFCMN